MSYYGTLLAFIGTNDLTHRVVQIVDSLATGDLFTQWPSIGKVPEKILLSLIIIDRLIVIY